MLVTEDEINGFVVNETVGGVAILGADFVTKKRAKADLGDDVEFFTKEVVEHLETLFFGADHKVFAGAVFETVNGLTLAAAGSNADENGHKKQE